MCDFSTLARNLVVCVLFCPSSSNLINTNLDLGTARGKWGRRRITLHINPSLPTAHLWAYTWISDLDLEMSLKYHTRLPWWLRWWSICLQSRRPGFDPWVGNIPWRRKWQPTPVLLPRKSYGRRSLVQATAHGVTKSWTQLSDFTILNKVTSTQCQYKIAKYSTDYLFSIWKSLVRDLLHLYA